MTNKQLYETLKQHLGHECLIGIGQDEDNHPPKIYVECLACEEYLFNVQPNGELTSNEQWHSLE
jgi:hypothetical protein